MMKKKPYSLLALLLAVVLLLQGCMPIWDLYAELLSGGPRHERPDYSNGNMDYTQYERVYEPRLEQIPFDDIQYVRPDAEDLQAQFEAIAELAQEGASADAIIDAYDAAYDDYILFNTMLNLIYIYYTLDLSNAEYEEEYLWCEAQSPLVEQAMEECCQALASSRQRDALESEYFGAGYFSSYDGDGVYTNERVVELLQQESELQSQYMAMTSNMTVEYRGEELLINDALAEADYDTYVELLELYSQKYNPQAAELYIELIRIRKELAAELGYDSYAEFAFDYYYGRDYTPEQAQAYLEQIRQLLVPLYTEYSGTLLPDYSAEETMALLSGAAELLGGEIWTAYTFMDAYDLYDLSASSTKMPGSYSVYLESYEMPFVYVSPEGNLNDLLSTAHEFGHFVDAYVNCNLTDSIDCAEVFSQGLEYLTLSAADLSEFEYRMLKKAKLWDALETFLSQACDYAFECAAYELPEEELTPERLNELFYQCSCDYGLNLPDYEVYSALGWFDVQHFFIAPYYVISYCVSNDVALQIYQMEQEQEGAGLEKYCELLYLTESNGILTMAEEGGLVSPFAEGRVELLAAFLEEQLQ